MRRNRIFYCLAAWLAFSSFSAAGESVVIESPDSDFRFQLGLESWFSTGESSWQISFLEPLPRGGVIRGRSRLEWEDLDSILYILRGEFRFTPWFSLSAAYGFGDMNDGRNTDTDWYDFPGGTFLLAQSVADSDGDVTLFNIDAYVRLSELYNLGQVPGHWDLVFGYRYYEEDLRDRNGLLTMLEDQPVRIPFEGLNSTYRFEWSAFRLGLRGEIPLRERVRMHAEVIGLLGVEFDGEAFWNLREDFRNEPPNFVQSATAGTGAEVRLAAAYDFTPNFYGELGFWWFRMRARNGTDRTFFADGEEGRARLDWVETKRYGVGLGLGGRF